LIRYIFARLLRKILSLFIAGVSVRGISSSWSSEEAIFLKKAKKEVGGKDAKKTKKREKETLAKVNDLDRQVQKLAKDYSQTSTRAEELAKEIAATSQKIEAFGKELATNQELTVSLTTAIEANNAKMESLTSQFAENRQNKEKDSADSDLTALTKQVNFMIEKLDGLQNQIAGITTSNEQLPSTGMDYQENQAKQESAISQISSRVDTIEREMVLKIYERLDAIDNNLSASKNGDTPFGQVTNHHRTVFPESVNEQVDDSPKVDLGEEIRKLSERIAILENHTSSYGEKLGALQNSISSVTKRLDNIEDGNSVSRDAASENEL
jgi:chromosome segregation ATPase